MAWRAIQEAGYLLFGNEKQQFAKLWSYGYEILKIMKFVCLDGCFLKGAFTGQILVAVWIDGNNGIYPVAWTIVEMENTDTWTWFGLEIAIQREVPQVEHRLCVKHFHANWNTFKAVYNHTLEPLGAPSFWPNPELPEILPPDIRVLPGRPKKCRIIDVQELKEKAEKVVEEKAKKVKEDNGADLEVLKASRKRSVIHYKVCGGASHNARTNPKKYDSMSQPAPTNAL
ncbi:hypothetical protein LIER_12397 [Lithospermum erythrorhizon]|uniref:MULE transposase domain-containing protein n=1 Tax=Lithospermum erythrorhizon TaxID=34254 RepID=A0AAV3PWT2_LITER